MQQLAHNRHLFIASTKRLFGMCTPHASLMASVHLSTMCSFFVKIDDMQIGDL